MNISTVSVVPVDGGANIIQFPFSAKSYIEKRVKGKPILVETLDGNTEKLEFGGMNIVSLNAYFDSKMCQKYLGVFSLYEKKVDCSFNISMNGREFDINGMIISCDLVLDVEGAVTVNITIKKA